jgi:threonylcarbamoyladenosine tRNA methylthiotransferase MtaB
MLSAMRRRYKRELYQSRVETIKKWMPDACIGVDVIAGFPGETDAHFEETYAFLRDLDISYLHVFTYSERPNTKAMELEGVVPQKIREERNARLQILSEKKKRAFYQRFAGEVRNVLPENEEKNGWMFGFTDNYIKVALPYHPEWVNQLMSVTLDELNEEGIFVGKVPELVLEP